MMKFIDKIIEFIHKESKNELREWVIILPSDRARVFFMKALYQYFKKPIFAPQIFTITQWVQGMTSQSILDKTSLTLELFEVHKEIYDDQVSFDDFLAWSNTLLSDFDEIDRYLVDTKMLFRNLRDIKEIENWSFNSENLTESQKKFMEFWDKLPLYYELLEERLKNNNSIYFGKAFKNIATDINVITGSFPEKKFLFAGFNALSEAESSIFKQLKNLGIAEILIDADEYYLRNSVHEAGLFLRKNMKDWQVTTLPFIENSLSTKKMNIDIIECAQYTGQAKVAATLLKKLPEDEMDSTLLLLADENLIVSVINNIPDNLKKVNITLGLPLKNTPVKSWIELIFRIQERFNQKKNQNSIYYKELFSIWRHPFITSILQENELFELQKKELDLKQSNFIYFSKNNLDVKYELKSIIDLLYSCWDNNWLIAIQTIRKLNRFIYDLMPDSKMYEKALIDSFEKSLLDFENCVEKGFPPMQLKTFINLFNQQWRGSTIAYFGNPTEGMQIMGLLETRLLDFKKVIVVGLNEGAMPKTNPIQSIIPMDLRRFFKLPTPREKQGLFAHHFYRLLHGCEDLTLCFYRGSEGINQNEESRYINQIRLELAYKNPNVTINEKFYNVSSDEINSLEKVEIEKSEEILQRLDNLFLKGVSASAINSYLYCPLNFYYERILKFREEDKIEEEIEVNTFGTFIHNVLEQLYTPFARFDKETLSQNTQVVNVTSHDIDFMKANYKKLLEKQFLDFYKGNKEVFTKGKNFIHFTIASEIIKSFLNKEYVRVKKNPNEFLFIEGLELKLKSTLNLLIHGRNVEVNLVGLVDRIDNVNDEIFIYDYKTGSVKRETLVQNKSRFQGTDLELLFDLSLKEPKLFQLMTYCYLYKTNFNKIPKEVGIIPLAKLSEDYIYMKCGNLSIEEIIDLYPELIQMILESVYDVQVPFEHKVRHNSYCKFCV